LGIECRSGDSDALDIIRKLQHEPTSQRCLAKRRSLRDLERGRQAPIGLKSVIKSNQLRLTGVDGSRLIRNEVLGNCAEPEAVGSALAALLKQQGAEDILNGSLKSYTH